MKTEDFFKNEWISTTTLNTTHMLLSEYIYNISLTYKTILRLIPGLKLAADHSMPAAWIRQYLHTLAVTFGSMLVQV